jgi:hypothetical protein
MGKLRRLRQSRWSAVGDQLFNIDSSIPPNRRLGDRGRRGNKEGEQQKKMLDMIFHFRRA